MSMYDPLWAVLKVNHTASVVVNRNHHARVVKAVKKRKWLDLGYKIQIEPKVALLSHTCSGNTLTFYLTLDYTKHVTHDSRGMIIL